MTWRKKERGRGWEASASEKQQRGRTGWCDGKGGREGKEKTRHKGEKAERIGEDEKAREKGGRGRCKEGMCGGAARTLEKAGDTHTHTHTHTPAHGESAKVWAKTLGVCGKFLNGSGKKCERGDESQTEKSGKQEREKGKNNGRLGHLVKRGRRKKGPKVGSCRARRGAFSATGLVARGAETRESRVEFEREERRAFFEEGERPWEKKSSGAALMRVRETL